MDTTEQQIREILKPLHVNEQGFTCATYSNRDCNCGIDTAIPRLTALIAAERLEAENKIYAEAEKVCDQHKNHLMTPVRSVTGVATSYCQFSRVVLSELTAQAKAGQA